MQHGGLHLHRLIPIGVNTSLPVIKQVETQFKSYIMLIQSD